MDDRMMRALARWPDVPALYGWLSLDRRGRWCIQGELITRPQIIDTIGRNYLADERGAWYFQNGPQRGYVTLAYAPLVLRVADDGTLHTHTDRPVRQPTAAFIDENGALLLRTEHGPALLDEHEADWLLAHLAPEHGTLDEAALEDALTRPDGAPSGLTLRLDDTALPVERLDRTAAPTRLGFVRDPRPEDA